MNPESRTLEGLTVVVAGAAGESGVACVTTLRRQGATVVAVGSNPDRLEAALGHLPGVDLRVCDLTDLPAVTDLARNVSKDHPTVDGVIHLVGGWRGAAGIAEQLDNDYNALHLGSVTTLRNTSRVWFDQLAASPRGRLVMVSSTAVDHPSATAASYAAVKAAAETWTRAVADGFRRAGDAAGSAAHTRSAATILVVKALLDDVQRANHPERSFPGFTHVDDLAAAVADVFTTDASTINGQRLTLPGSVRPTGQ